MYRILTASKDTYITNKIINNSFRATDANVGGAGTLDLFKLYAESSTGSDVTPIELSRILIKFNLAPLRALTSSTLDITHPSFKCTLKLTDVYGGQTTPSNFKLILFPLSKSFNEGIGRDVVSFADVGSANFITASSGSAWTVTGANHQGDIDSEYADIISSGSLGDDTENLFQVQTFEKGTENLEIDVTKIVSATLEDILPDEGFRISFSGTQETDTATRFVKRFASRHATNFNNRPKLIVAYDDAVIDHHENFFFNLSGTLFLNNYHRNSLANLLSGSAGLLHGVSGSNCLTLRIESGSVTQSTFFTKTITASQHKVGDNFITGMYSATFALNEFTVTQSLRDEILNAGSATFREFWGSVPEEGSDTGYDLGYFTSSFVVRTVDRSAFSNVPSRLYVNITNLNSTYKTFEKARLRVFVEDLGREIKAEKLPLETKSEVYTRMFYRVRDYDSGNIIIPFETESNGTKLSTDTNGLYFDFYMDALAPGRMYAFDFIIKDGGIDQIFTDVPARFSVDE
tara:strand:+ start:2011 stop:3561 length:1551 start_codon:yes stop_codon:yes gene_type:complete